MRVIDRINASMDAFLGSNPSAYLIGEDIVDPYGGAFKATKGLSTRYPGRVLSTPICEATLAGFATGMAMKGKPVCVEIMFGDFVTLCTDQLVNHMSKLPWVYNDQIRVPVVVRAPMGGKRGYGATHSQSLEKHFCGVPGLTVRAVSQYCDIDQLYADAFAAGTPHLIIENKLLYARGCEPDALPHHDTPDMVIVTYGGSTEVCVGAARQLESQEELLVNVIDVTALWPFDHDGLRAAVGDCAHVLVVEEGTTGWGFAAEVAHALIGKPGLHFDTLSAPDHPLPSARDWEVALLPSQDRVIEKIMEALC